MKVTGERRPLRAAISARPFDGAREPKAASHLPALRSAPIHSIQLAQLAGDGGANGGDDKGKLASWLVYVSGRMESF